MQPLPVAGSRALLGVVLELQFGLRSRGSWWEKASPDDAPVAPSSAR